jgi:hypothetical protein
MSSNRACECRNAPGQFITWLHVQVPSETDVAARFDRATATELPGGRGVDAWSTLLRAHATLLRRLETYLERKTGLALDGFARAASSGLSEKGWFAGRPRTLMAGASSFR